MYYFIYIYIYIYIYIRIRIIKYYTTFVFELFTESVFYFFKNEKHFLSSLNIENSEKHLIEKQYSATGLKNIIYFFKK